jgi:hypothetical protein
MRDLEDVRLFLHRGALYLQFVGYALKYEEKGEERGRETRQWLGRLDRMEQV